MSESPAARGLNRRHQPDNEHERASESPAARGLNRRHQPDDEHERASESPAARGLSRRHRPSTLCHMDKELQEDVDRDTTTDAGTAEVIDEQLIEEISIDGMCGVY